MREVTWQNMGTNERERYAYAQALPVYEHISCALDAWEEQEQQENEFEAMLNEAENEKEQAWDKVERLREEIAELEKELEAADTE